MQLAKHNIFTKISPVMSRRSSVSVVYDDELVDWGPLSSRGRGRPALGLTKPPVKWVPVSLPREVTLTPTISAPCVGRALLYFINRGLICTVINSRRMVDGYEDNIKKYQREI